VKNSKLHIIRTYTLLLLTLVFLFTASGAYSNSINTKATTESTQKSTQNKKENKEEATVSPTIEAVVVSTLNPEFVKAIVFTLAVVLPVEQTERIVCNHSIVATNYFETLFTHIISPNAP